MNPKLRSGSTTKQVKQPAVSTQLSSATGSLPRIGLLLGDPSGIGPEIVAKLLAHPSTREIGLPVLLGSERVWQRGLEIAGVRVSVHEVAEVPQIVGAEESVPLLRGYPLEPADYALGKASALGGRYVLETSRFALELAQKGKIDGLCFAPFNKEAMHLAGSPFEDDLRYFTHVLEYEGYVGELNVLDNLWTARVTSHVALKEVAALVTEERVEAAIELVHRSLVRAGIEKPRIAVAALNPHAGEGGLFGREEIDVIRPVVKRLTALFDVRGPLPSDTIFLKAQAGEVDAVVTMYHDQGQVAMKLMGFSRGVTVHGGLPVVVTTPAHGTAYDIAGQGSANESAMVEAYRMACQMATQQK